MNMTQIYKQVLCQLDACIIAYSHLHWVIQHLALLEEYQTLCCRCPSDVDSFKISFHSVVTLLLYWSLIGVQQGFIYLFPDFYVQSFCTTSTCVCGQFHAKLRTYVYKLSGGQIL